MVLPLRLKEMLYQIIEFQHVKPGKGRCIRKNQIKKCHQRWCSRAYLPSD